MTMSKNDLKALRSLFELILEERGIVTKDDIKHLPNKQEFYGKMDEVMNCF